MNTPPNRNRNVNGDKDAGNNKRKSDFEKYIEESLEDADMINDDEIEEENIEDIISIRKQEVMPLHPTAQEIAEIISKHDLIEKAKQERVRNILERQIRVYERKSEIIERLQKELTILTKKQKIAKNALRKAKDVKLDKDVVALIKKDLGYIKEARNTCDDMIGAEKKELKKIGLLINLLDSAT